ncbi:uncharacterized protein LOC111785776 [Cucurbita pepo subsp. pepo]|uniref:uncharacterized protein LOC111785776 n=1 Tax=Cucurbita pepo subsp. pepo TaxID=3664 RepID=UPI000C9D4F17|nr:uncharacterized protein LOC111785776 [Cucurbita pepo subsp. pepo]
MPMPHQGWLQLRKGFLSLNFTKRNAPIRKTKMVVKRRMMKMTTMTMMQMIRMTTTTTKIFPEVKKGMMVIQRMILKQMATEELEVMRKMMMRTTTMERTRTTMRTRKKTRRRKTRRRKHLSHQLRRGSENIDWPSTSSSFEQRGKFS